MMKKGKSNFTVSIRYDKRLYDYDIRGSLAHVHMLSKVGIINESDANEIKKGLDLIRKEIESDKLLQICNLGQFVITPHENLPPHDEFTIYAALL